MPAVPSAPRRRSPGTKSRLGLWVWLAIGVLLLGYALAIFNTRARVDGDRLRLDEFFALANTGGLRDARLLDQDQYIVGQYQRSDGSVARYNVPIASGGGKTSVLEVLLNNNVPTEVDRQFSKGLIQPATMILPALIVVLVFVYLTLSYRRGSGLFSVRSGAERFAADDVGSVTFADVAGQEAAITELKEIRDFLQDPQRYRDLGVQVPKGILLFGPPGCGKTLLARAVAGESGASFFSISGSDFVEMYVGVGAARVRDLFREAREHVPAIVFIDELDAIGRRRGGQGGAMGSQDEQEQALNQVLAEMDGFSPLQGILVIGATNRPDILDPALLRPGRFDRSIALERPDEAGRLAILERHLGGKALAPGTELAELARRSVGLSGADMASVANEAALLAARRNGDHIAIGDLDAALDRIMEAPERWRRLTQRSRSFTRTGGAGERRVTFADVAGADEAIADLAEVRDFLADPSRYLAMGARPPKGFLLDGPPGVGKTLLARAVAHETNAAFFAVSGSEFVEALVGEGAARVRDLFAEARMAAPAIIFIDELDAVGGRRSGSVHNGREQDQTLNQILVEMDGFDSQAGVTVLAATNRPDMLDPALVRPGRFDRRVRLDLPDREARSAILAIHARGLPLSTDVDLAQVAGMAQGYSGAELANLLNEAALLATRAGHERITAADVGEGFARVRVGSSRAVALSPDDRLKVAYHEMAHALVGRILPGARNPQIVSVVARGRSLGATWDADESDRLIHGRSALIDQMATILAGQVAEEVVFGEPASTSADDLRRVSHIARRMVCELGMGKALSRRSYLDGSGPDGDSSGHSEAMARAIEDEVAQLVDEAERRARSVIIESREILDVAARVLVERESITAAEIEQLVRPQVPAQA